MAVRSSIVIPTLNGGTDFEKCLDMISRQRTDAPFEVIVIDSGSSDGTLALAQRFGTRKYLIRKSQFNHGLTRQWGAQLAKGDYVVFCSQDAVPADEDWLEALLQNFSDPLVAGAYSRQLARPDCDPIARNALETWITGSEARSVQRISAREEYDALSAWNKRLFVNFDDVSSCVRKEMLLQFPYADVKFGEDIEWSRRVMEAGYKIVYEPRSRVLHSHKTSIIGNYRRAVLDQRMAKELLGVDLFAELCGSSFYSLLGCTIKAAKAQAHAIRKSSLPLAVKWKWMLYAGPVELAKNLGMLRGIASAHTEP